MANRPEPEIDITVELAQTLIDEQFPGLSGQPLRLMARGWDNTNLRLGEDHVVRLPHREAAAELIVNEQRWLPILAPNIDLAIPTPTHAGRPSNVYPWHWSVTPWLPGTEAALAPPDDPADAAETLGRFLCQTHVEAPDEAPENPVRGCPLASRAAAFAANTAALGDLEPRLVDIFRDACNAPAANTRVWLHGDLHTRNMIVDGGRLSAVIDWGDICAGDPATDLAAAFMLVPGHVDLVQSHAGANDTDWLRARGWAAHLAAVYLANSDDEPVMAAIGRRLAEALGRG